MIIWLNSRIFTTWHNFILSHYPQDTKKTAQQKCRGYFTIVF